LKGIRELIAQRLHLPVAELAFIKDHAHCFGLFAGEKIQKIMY